MVNDNDITNYRYEVIESFLTDALDIEEVASHQTAEIMLEKLDKKVILKLVHFFDMINQTTKGCTPKCSKCNGSCKECSEN